MSKARRASGAPRIHSVILAGGAGERFWPASRRHRPKPFLEVVGGKSLLEATLSRARRCAGSDERVWVVCGHEHGRALRKECGLPSGHVLIEPARRNTAMAVAWVAQRIAAEDPGAVLVILPADHHVPDERAFERDIKRAARAADGAEVLVTIGVEPTRPETGYGYIRVGEPAPKRYAGLRRVERFVEKPDRARAKRFLRQGGHLWNAGVFVWRAQSFLEEVERHAPELHRALEPLRRAPRSRRRAVVEDAYAQAPSLPVDVAILEKSDRVWTLPVRFAWSDVGTWESLAAELGVGTRGRACESQGTNRVIAGDVLFSAADGNLVWGQNGRVVALLGVEDLAVIDTGDVILVTKLDASPDVRGIVAELREHGRDELT